MITIFESAAAAKIGGVLPDGAEVDRAPLIPSRIGGPQGELHQLILY